MYEGSLWHKIRSLAVIYKHFEGMMVIVLGNTIGDQFKFWIRQFAFHFAYILEKKSNKFICSLPSVMSK